MSQITIRQIPESLEKQIRDLAAKNNTSLNKTIIKILINAFGMKADFAKKRDLSDLHGSWNQLEIEEFNNNIEELNKIDPEMWK